ncbi:MAG: prolipoprotein diacylglyceryl transferase family protein [bacterium]
MSAAVVVGGLTVCLVALFTWAFRVLPGEEWQILAVWPHRREPDGAWRGKNLTYYGVFNALGLAVGVGVAIFLPGTVGLPRAHLMGCVLGVLAVVLPASKVINRIVEGHWHGFTVGGGSFAGMVAGPWVVWGVSRLTLPAADSATATLYVLGALAPAYALGEGIGRLACISFGCCYGRPMAECPPWLRTLFSRRAFVFRGRLKKSSYAHGLEGQRLLPIQAVTSVVSSLAGLVGLALFLSGRPAAAFVLTMAVTQVWRFSSEFLRADYRGAGRISAYQWMALVGAAYTVLFGLLWSGSAWPAPDVARGLALLWRPGTILFIEAVAIVVFVSMGVSTVTTARVVFDLDHDRVAPRPLRTTDLPLIQG